MEMPYNGEKLEDRGKGPISEIVLSMKNWDFDLARDIPRKSIFNN